MSASSSGKVLAGRRLLLLGSLGFLFWAAAVEGVPPSVQTAASAANRRTHGEYMSALQIRSDEGDANDDEALGESDLKEEDACEGQEVMANVMKADAKKLQDGTSPWVRFLSHLTSVKDNKQVCVQSASTENLCKLPPPKEGEKGPTRLPCGGDDYMAQISSYVRMKNCILSLGVTNTLMQNWLGHEGNEGILKHLISQYGKAMEFPRLDSELYYIYKESKQLLEEVAQSAKDGLAAFHSVEIKAVFLRRRRELVSLLCALGRGPELEAGANVVVTDRTVVIRGAFGEGQKEALDAFVAAVNAFGVFVKALLEEGGYLDRATEIHRSLHKFRFSRLNAMFSDVEPTTNEGDEALALMRIIPVKPHKKRSHHQEVDPHAGPNSNNATPPSSFLEVSLREAPSTPSVFSSQPTAAPVAVVGATGAPGVAGSAPPSAAAPAPAAAGSPPAAAVPATQAVSGQAPAAPTSTASGVPAAVSQQAATPPAAAAPAVPPPPAAAPPAAGSPQPPSATAPVSPPPSVAQKSTGAGIPGASQEATPGLQPADKSADEAERKVGVPIRKKIVAMATKLRMFAVHGDELTYAADTVSLDKTIKAGYTDISDKVFVTWAQLLPQAFTLTTFKFLALLVPSPQVDIAEFYESTMSDDGTIKEGYVGDPPVNHKLLVERFALAVDDAYKDSWRRFFSVADDLGIGTTQLPAVPKHGKGAPVSVLERGVVKPHSFVDDSDADGFTVAIVASSEGMSAEDLQKFADTEAIDRGSVGAMASSGLAVTPHLTSIVLLATCAAVAFMK